MKLARPLSAQSWRRPLAVLFVLLFVLMPLTVQGTARSAATTSATAGAGPFNAYGLPTIAATLRNQAGINEVPSMHPGDSFLNPDSWWCASWPAGNTCYRSTLTPPQTVTTTITYEMSLSAQLGVSNIREEFPWYGIARSQPGGATYSAAAAQDPACPCYDWSRADLIVKTAIADGLNIDAIVLYTPPWEGSSNTTVPTASHFYDFVYAMAKRYQGAIHYWELWNEPNQSYLTGSEQQYVTNIEIPGYNALKTVDAGNQIVLAGTSSPYCGAGQWYDQLYTLDPGHHWDIVSIHDYSGDPGSNAQNATACWTLEQSHGDSAPIWLGETGFPAPNVTSGISVTNQSNLFVGNLQRMPGNHLAMMQYYHLVDDFPMVCCPPVPHENNGMGLILHNYIPKASYSAAQAYLTGGSGAPSAVPSTTPSATNSPVPPSTTPSATNSPVPPSTTPSATNTPTTTPLATSTPMPPSNAAPQVPATATNTPTGTPAATNMPTSVPPGGANTSSPPNSAVVRPTGSMPPTTMATQTAAVTTAIQQRSPATMQPSRSKPGQHSVHQAALPLTITLTPQRVMSGHILIIRVHTAPNSRVTVTVEVTTTQWSMTGTGQHRHRTRHTIVLYRVLVHSAANARGGAMARMRITYKPATSILARVIGNARLLHRTSTRTAWIVILPRSVVAGHKRGIVGIHAAALAQ